MSEYEVEVKLQRGTKTDDRDVLKSSVSSQSIDELDEKVEQMRQKMEEWAADFRNIQPQQRRSISDDQATLQEGSA